MRPFHTRAAMWRATCGTAAAVAAVVLAACARDQVTSPVQSTVPRPGPASFMTVTPLGTYSIPIPDNNLVNSDGRQPAQGTSILVPAGSYYRVRVIGKVVTTGNPLWPNCAGGSVPQGGSYGPYGTGSFGQLYVTLSARNTDGSGSGNINFLNLQPTDSVARSDVLYANKDIEIVAGRNGIAGGCNKNDGTAPYPAYYLTASQSVVVEKVTDVARLTATPSYAKHGQVVAFRVTFDDSVAHGVYGWQWVPKPGQSGPAANGWTSSSNDKSLDWAPWGSGTMYVTTSAGVAAATVTLYSSFSLSTDRTSVNVGDTVTFTALYDGVAGPAARWRWVADDTSTHDVVSCADATGPCKKTMTSSGTMWAYSSATSGDSASQHVTVKHVFEVVADKYSAYSGDSVTFTAMYDGVVGQAAHWRWVPDSSGATVACSDGTSTCEIQIIASGTMWGFSNASLTDSAGKKVIVTVGSSCGGSLVAGLRSRARMTMTVCSPPADSVGGDGTTTGLSPSDSLATDEWAQGGCYEVPGTATPAGGGGTWNPSKFATTLRANAKLKSTGKCATFVRKALCAAGITGACDGYQHPLCAKDYGPFLESLGFHVVATGSGRSADGYPPGYTPQIGDVAVVIYDPSGHIGGWDGFNWTSDYVQPDLEPYPGSRPNLPYTIYRRSP